MCYGVSTHIESICVIYEVLFGSLCLCCMWQWEICPSCHDTSGRKGDWKSGLVTSLRGDIAYTLAWTYIIHTIERVRSRMCEFYHWQAHFDPFTHRMYDTVQYTVSSYIYRWDISKTSHAHTTCTVCFSLQVPPLLRLFFKAHRCNEFRNICCFNPIRHTRCAMTMCLQHQNPGHEWKWVPTGIYVIRLGHIGTSLGTY